LQWHGKPELLLHGQLGMDKKSTEHEVPKKSTGHVEPTLPWKKQTVSYSHHEMERGRNNKDDSDSSYLHATVVSSIAVSVTMYILIKHEEKNSTS
jgi:hypothetical protein